MSNLKALCRKSEYFGERVFSKIFQIYAILAALKVQKYDAFNNREKLQLTCILRVSSIQNVKGNCVGDMVLTSLFSPR
jgi:hypothetical protein